MNQRPTPAKRSEAITEFIAWIARGLICGLLLIAPWPYAMAHWSEQLWLVPIVGAVLLLAAVVALLRRISVGNPLVWALAGVILVGCLQIVPLPRGLWKTLSPAAGFEQQVAQLADEFAAADEAADEATPPSSEESAAAEPAETLPPPAPTISISPLQTRTTLCVFAMGLGMLISASILFRDRASVVALMGSLTLSGLAISLLGIYQAVVAGDWTLLDVPKQTSFATFYSRNSAPQFLASAFAAAGGLLALYHAHQSKQQQKNADKRYEIVYPSVNVVARLRRRAEQFVADADAVTFLCLVGMIAVFVSVLVANSRGGILAFAASGVAVSVVYALGRQAGWSAGVVLILLVVGAGLFLSFFGIDELVGARLDTLSEEAYKLDNVRLEIWQMAASQPSFWALGSGLGTFHFALLPAYSVPQSVQFYHAENIYIELASGAGVVTLLIALAGLGWFLWQLLTKYAHSNTARATRFACLFALLAVALQNLVDFSLMLPAVFLPLAALSGAYLGTRHQVRHKVRVRSSSSRAHAAEQSALRQQRLREYSQQLGAPATATASRPLATTEMPAAPTHRHQPETTWAPAALVVCLLLISVAVAVGYRPLAAFAFAEQLDISPSSTTLVSDIEAANASTWAKYPEAHLMIGRMRQALAEQQLINSDRWPAEVTQAMRQSLAQPEFFSTVFHGTEDEELSSLREFLSEETAALENLRDSQHDMLQTLAGCPLDWRASWGLMRSDTGDLSDAQRRRNYARLALTSRGHAADFQAAATHALLVGQSAAALRMWRELLPVYYTARVRVLALVGRFMTTEQLLSILPPEPLQRLEMARTALNSYRLDEVSLAVLETVELEEVAAKAHYIADWELVAWAAQRRGNLNQEIQAWKRAVLEDPRNPSHSHALALALERGGRLEDALVAIRDALGISGDNAVYQEVEKRLTKALGQ